VDPEASNTESSAETGIVVVGGALVESRLHGYVLEDASIKASPQGWATAAVTAFYKHKANYIVAEVNQGGTWLSLQFRR
jgi:phage terminase large subunit-like protein